MSRDIKYIGMDVHKEAIVIAVLNGSGKLVMETILETKASSILQFIHGLRGELHVTWEEGTWAAWLYDLLQPQVQASSGLQSAPQCLIKGGQQERQGGCAQAGRIAAHRNAATGLPRRKRTTNVARVGAQLSDHQQRFDPGDESAEGTVSRVGHRLCRHPGLCPRYREEWLSKIAQAGVRRRAELLYQQLDGLQALRRNLRPEFLAESRKHKAAKLLRQIPCIGPIRAARLIALMQTPHRFRSKRQLWTYSGLGIETHDSAQYRYVRGQLQRSKKPQQLRGLNQNHNHEMKEIFKSTATRASCGRGPFHDFYAALLAKGMKPEMARLTLARKIAAITLTLWKRGERFDAEQLKTQAA